MLDEKTSLAALIGSRICHDLISPIGAISNGLELASLTKASSGGPEMDLIQQSCNNASARIRFFRVAFGSGQDTHITPASEARSTLLAHYAGTRISASLNITDDMPRSDVQLAYLTVLCLETALPKGGTCDVEADGTTLFVTARGRSLVNNTSHWGWFDIENSGPREDISPSTVQFPMLAHLCQLRTLQPKVSFSESSAEVRLTMTTRADWRCGPMRAHRQK